MFAHLHVLGPFVSQTHTTWGGIFGEKKTERSCNNEVMLLPILLKAERRPLKMAGGKVAQVCILPPGPPNSGHGLNGAYLLPSPQELLQNSLWAALPSFTAHTPLREASSQWQAHAQAVFCLVSHSTNVGCTSAPGTGDMAQLPLPFPPRGV